MGWELESTANYTQSCAKDWRAETLKEKPLQETLQCNYNHLITIDNSTL